MIAVWPSDLPRPSREDFQKTWADPRIKKRADAGPSGYRRRFSSVPKLVSMSIEVNRAGKDLFEQFFEETTSFGSLPFEMPDPTTQGWALTTNDGVPILDDNGRPVLRSGTWLCLFGDQMPVETIRGTQFRFSFSVLVMP